MICTPDGSPPLSQTRGLQVYEDFFGLQQRPFVLVPHAEDFVEISSLQEALDSLVHCVTQSRGIAIMTSDPGLGKTMLCRRLIKLLEQNYRSIYLSAAGMETRLSLLQAILFELNMGYVGLTDHEARLKLLDAARSIRPERSGFLLIVDEAQNLSPRLFEEIRTLTEYAPEGVPLIQAVLAGSFELEEKLIDPALSSFSQRIGLQLCLNPLTLSESACYLSERFQTCGAKDLLEIIDEEALDLICRASDGNFQCLNQLADHACMLAYADGTRPIHRAIIRQALEDLKELPLRWSDVPGELAFQEQPPASSAVSPPGYENPRDLATIVNPPSKGLMDLETDEFLIPDFLRARNDNEKIVSVPEMSSPEPDPRPIPAATGPSAESSEFPESPEFAVFEVGGDLDLSGQLKQSGQLEHSEWTKNDHLFGDSSIANTIPLFDFGKTPADSVSEEKEHSRMTEIPVIDRYAFLDHLFELPEERRTPEILERLKTIPISTAGKPASVSTEDIPEKELLNLVQEIRQDLRHHMPADQPSMVPVSLPHRFPTPVGSESAAPSQGPDSVIPPPQKTAPTRRFEQLFTRLRLRRKRIEAEQRPSGQN